MNKVFFHIQDRTVLSEMERYTLDIRARGLHGSWRLLNGDYTAPVESVVQGLQDMQPEDFELMLIEVQIGEI